MGYLKLLQETKRLESQAEKDKNLLDSLIVQINDIHSQTGGEFVRELDKFVTKYKQKNQISLRTLEISRS